MNLKHRVLSEGFVGLRSRNENRAESGRWAEVVLLQETRRHLAAAILGRGLRPSRALSAGVVTALHPIVIAAELPAISAVTIIII